VAAIERLVEVINAKDVAGMDEVFHDNAIMEWPQSGERVPGAENRRAIYSRFPTVPHIAPKWLTTAEDLVVLEADLDYDGPALGVGGDGSADHSLTSAAGPCPATP
jgi:hypothetical protein